LADDCIPESWDLDLRFFLILAPASVIYFTVVNLCSGPYGFMMLVIPANPGSGPGQAPESSITTQLDPGFALRPCSGQRFDAAHRRQCKQHKSPG